MKLQSHVVLFIRDIGTSFHFYFTFSDSSQRLSFLHNTFKRVYLQNVAFCGNTQLNVHITGRRDLAKLDILGKPLLNNATFEREA